MEFAASQPTDGCACDEETDDEPDKRTERINKSQSRSKWSKMWRRKVYNLIKSPASHRMAAAVAVVA